MEDVIAIGKEEADKYYDNLQLTSVYSYDNDHDNESHWVSGYNFAKRKFCTY